MKAADSSFEKVVAEIEASVSEAFSTDAPVGRHFHNHEIKTLIGETVLDCVRPLGLVGQMAALADIEDASSIRVDQATKADLGGLIEEILVAALCERLEPFRARLEQRNYDGRVVPLLIDVGVTASMLADTPASLFVKREDVRRFCGVVDAIVTSKVAPGERELCDALETGVGFFETLSAVLKWPDAGQRAGITEQSIGFPSDRITELFASMSDVHHLSRRPLTSALFRRALAEELSELEDGLRMAARGM